MTTGIGAAMAGGNPQQGRNKDDFYPTPAECTVGLLDAEEHFIKKHGLNVWEPACGDGLMASLISNRGFSVKATDLVYRGYGDPEPLDFLDNDREEHGMAIITNPPFNLAPQFIRASREKYDAPYLALLLKSTFWHAASRYQLFIDHPPSMIYPLTWRPDFMKRGAPTMDCTWFVWDVARSGTSYHPMKKPAP